MSNIDLSPDKIINPYDDIAVALLNEGSDNLYGSQYLNDVRSLQVGYGGKVLRADSQGIWLGAEEFADAPFSVDMEGNVTAVTLTLGSLAGDLDDIDDGSSYAKTTLNEVLGASYAYNGLNTSGEIIKGFLNSQLSAKALPTNGVRVDASGIYGRNAGVTTFYLDSAGNAYFIGDIYSSSMSASTITGSTITGTTLTTASSGQRVVLTSTLARFYNSSGTLMASTYAGSSSYWIKGEQSTSGVYLDCGYNGSVSFLSDGDLKIVYDPVNEVFVPYNNYGVGLGAAGAYWGDFYCSDIDCSDINAYAITGSSFTLDGDTITSWADLGSYVDVATALDNLGGMSNVTLNVRRVSGGVDSGYYTLSFDYGLLTGASVN